MVFSSIVFLLLFFPLFFIGYYLMPNKGKNYYVLFSSIFFYSWGAPKFIFVILGTTLIDFFLVRTMDKSSSKHRRRLILVISVCMNLGLLFYFKYCNFFIDNINAVLGSFQIKPVKLLSVVLPIGISFYTFETLTYVVDVYRKVHKPLTNFMHYQLYIILFPKLIAGPIIRYHEIADQITDRFNSFTYNSALKGFHRFIIGLAKKVLIANTVGLYADTVFGSDLGSLSSGIAWLGILSYTMQIYFDFSGYSDMAIGLGQMMGFRFPENFNNPYTALSISDFWRRWHMTLGAWMRNYLYIPLGGNKVKSKRRMFFNLWLVFLLSGFWHGANWTFIIWGAYHGTFLVLEKTSYCKILKKTGKWPSLIWTFIIVNFGWIFFRETDLSRALQYIKSMFSFTKPYSPVEGNYPELYTFLIIGLLFSFFVAFKPLEKIQKHIYYDVLSIKQNIVYTVVLLMLLFICIALITASSFNPFIYFRF